jgi:DNA-binding LacI/PurR family transcriptional regulator
VVACSDVFAVSAMRALAEHERRVPADVAVVGFDDIPLAAYASPPLTTVRQDCHAGARLLVETLMRALREERTESTLIPTELVVRASSLRDHYRALPSINARRPTASGERERRNRNR